VQGPTDAAQAGTSPEISHRTPFQKVDQLYQHTIFNFSRIVAPAMPSLPTDTALYDAAL
jgi:hypothetical protein